MAWKNKEAERAYHRKYYAQRMARARKVLGDTCQHCGWNEYPEVLQFAHKHGYPKEIDISSSVEAAWSLVETELQKCLLLCPTCHAVYDLERKLPTSEVRSLENYEDGMTVVEVQLL